jgi:SpoVK/Ycf46/Vps4 family AAA+-type ATPase
MVDLPDLKTRSEILSVTLAHNRLAPNVNLTSLAESLEGYTGSDLKEICREAVVRVAHERAQLLESGSFNAADAYSDVNDEARTRVESKVVISELSTKDEFNSDRIRYSSVTGTAALMRPVNSTDFKEAIKKLKASVDPGGRELQKVLEWNEKYGEKKVGKKKAHLAMYV